MLVMMMMMKVQRDTRRHDTKYKELCRELFEYGDECDQKCADDEIRSNRLQSFQMGRHCLCCLTPTNIFFLPIFIGGSHALDSSSSSSSPASTTYALFPSCHQFYYPLNELWSLSNINLVAQKRDCEIVFQLEDTTPRLVCFEHVLCHMQTCTWDACDVPVLRDPTAHTAMRGSALPLLFRKHVVVRPVGRCGVDGQPFHSTASVENLFACHSRNVRRLRQSIPEAGDAHREHKVLTVHQPKRA